MYEEAKRVSELLHTIANPNRLMLLCALIDGEQTVGELAAILDTVSQSAVSQHLAILRTAGIVTCRKQGMSVIYSIADHRIESVIALLKEQYCS